MKFPINMFLIHQIIFPNQFSILSTLNLPRMEEEEELVILDYGLPMTKAGLGRVRKSVPTANCLFKNIENEIEAIKEIKQKQNQSAIHQKIKKALERKLGNPKLIRCMSAKEETRIKDLIETCKQRKHIRQEKQIKRPQTSKTRVPSSRDRNYSTKNANLKLQLSNSRPKTASPSRAISLRLHQSDTMRCSEVITINSKEKSKLKKKNHNRIYSKLPQTQKENSYCKTMTTKHIEKQNQFSHQKEQNNKYFEITPVPDFIKTLPHGGYGRKMKNKNMAKIKNKFHNILQTCDNERQEIICLGKKIGHFQYFCQKISSKKSKIEKFCRQTEEMQKELDQSF